MTTLVVYADAADGHVQYAHDGDLTIYSDSLSGSSTASSNTTGTGSTSGQISGGTGSGSIYQYFGSFDTSSVGSGSTVSSAVLSLTSNETQTSGDLSALLYDWGLTVTTADYRTGTVIGGLTVLGSHFASGGWTAGTSYDFSDTAFAANVSKTGTTRIMLASSGNISGTEPGAYVYDGLHHRTADYTGTTSDPKLTVTYTAGGGTSSFTSDPSFAFSSSATVAEDFALAAAPSFAFSSSATVAEDFALAAVPSFAFSSDASAGLDFALAAAPSFAFASSAGVGESFDASASPSFAFSSDASAGLDFALASVPSFAFASAVAVDESFDAVAAASFAFASASAVDESFDVSAVPAFAFASATELDWYSGFRVTGGPSFGFSSAAMAEEAFVASSAPVFRFYSSGGGVVYPPTAFQVRSSFGFSASVVVDQPVDYTGDALGTGPRPSVVRWPWSRSGLRCS